MEPGERVDSEAEGLNSLRQVAGQNLISIRVADKKCLWR